jgi:DNA-3-methyladenine glycosylase I
VAADPERLSVDGADETGASALAAGPDGRLRCWWSLGTAEYIRYHDEEWGRPVLDDRLFFEHLCLETFQSGLSWLTILRKREAFRAAFARFDPAAVAAFGDDDVRRLLADAGIVRNRRKIHAVIANAGAALELVTQHGSLAAFFWAYAERATDGAVRDTIRRREDIPAVSDVSAALAKELKRRGFRFLGPTTVYAHMQACGMVNDHVSGCFVGDEVQRLHVETRQMLRERGCIP